MCLCLPLQLSKLSEVQLQLGICQFYTLPAILNYRNTVVYVRAMKLSPTCNMSLIPLTAIFSVCYGLIVCVPKIQLLKPNLQCHGVRRWGPLGGDEIMRVKPSYIRLTPL